MSKTPYLLFLGDAPDALAAQIGAMDVVIQSQGTVRYGREEFAREGWDAVVDVNLNSVMDVARAFHAGLAEKYGAMVIISSVAGFKSTKGTPAYAASHRGPGQL